MVVQDEIRKGPWTEQEDILLINFVHLFGDRRWDFIAKVSGLKVEGVTLKKKKIKKKMYKIIMVMIGDIRPGGK